eukprot:TRINITY_DN12235_c0_g1_i7.p1 TRINITY_DN12235_c0_g1~~TRINITY_DN12235_c0_g1_i7.p1  ORF type:complete len:909 (+),score=232.46 TRINITY_DN12235_c0_g1_i7:26-2728(+)
MASMLKNPLLERHSLLGSTVHATSTALPPKFATTTNLSLASNDLTAVVKSSSHLPSLASSNLLASTRNTLLSPPDLVKEAAEPQEDSPNAKDRHQDGIFAGYTFAMEGLTSSAASKLKRLIVAHGGVVSFGVSEHVMGVLVERAPNMAGRPPFKLKQAVRMQIPLILTSFIQDCVDCNALKDFASYQCHLDSAQSPFAALPDRQEANKDATQDFVLPNVTILSHDAFCEQQAGVDYDVLRYHAHKRPGDGYCVYELHKLADDTFRVYHELGELNADKPANVQIHICNSSEHALWVYELVIVAKASDMLTMPLLQGVGSPRLQTLLSGGNDIMPGLTSVAPVVKAVYTAAATKMAQSGKAADASVLNAAEAALRQLWQCDDANQREQLQAKARHALSDDGLALSTPEDISAAMSIVRLNRDFLAASEAGGMLTNPLPDPATLDDETQLSLAYRSMQCILEPMQASSPRSKWLSTHMASLPAELEVKGSYKVHKPGEGWNPGCGNEQLLFHSTPASNGYGILSRGLLQPTLVVKGLQGRRTDAGRLGAGLYFAKDIKVALQYSTPAQDGSIFAFVCAVALGKSHTTTVDQPDLTQSPYGFNSVHAVGRQTDEQSSFVDDEFVVYHPKQQRLLYLLHLGPKIAEAAALDADNSSADAAAHDGTAEPQAQQPGKSKRKPKEKRMDQARPAAASWLPASHLTAAVLIPEDEVAEKVQAIRRQYDSSHVDLWPAHVTLLYPFVDPSQLDLAVTIIQDLVAKEDPIDLTLATVGQFDQGKRGCVHYLEPAEGRTIQQLTRRLAQRLGGHFKSAKIKAPHLTIGRRNRAEDQHPLSVLWNETGDPSARPCRLVLLKRPDNKTPMEVTHTFHLGQAPPAIPQARGNGGHMPKMLRSMAESDADVDVDEL